MSLTSRRILFAFFVLIFCILVPVVLLYATGHTINWYRFSLQKTGTILIDSQPRKASILLDGQPLQAGFLSSTTTLTTSARIKDIAPGDHKIRLELAGYWPWEEEFTLQPDEAINFNVIHLFKQDQPQLVLATNSKIGAASPRDNYFAIAEKGKVDFATISDASLNTVTIPDQTKLNAIQWSTDEQYISLASLIINRKDQSFIDLNKVANTNFNLFRWDSLDASTIWASQQRSLISYSTITQSINRFDLEQIPSNEIISDFEVYSNKAYIITQSSSHKETLYIGSLGDNLKILALNGEHNHFVLNGSPLPCLYSNNTLYVIDEPLLLFPTPRLVEAVNDFNTGEWINNGIVYGTQLELRRWDRNNNDTLLTRFGSPIVAVKTLQKSSSIIVALTDSIRLYSQGRVPYIILFSSLQNTAGLAVSADEKYLFSLGQYQGKFGLYRFAL